MAYQISKEQALDELHTQIEEYKAIWDELYNRAANHSALTTENIIHLVHWMKSQIVGTRKTLDLLERNFPY